MAKGDIVLITFPFTDLSGSKLRLLVVLNNTTFDLVVCFITTKFHMQELTDQVLMPNSSNGVESNLYLGQTKSPLSGQGFNKRTIRTVR